MAGKVRSHVRSNIYGLIAIFIALSGSAYAAITLDKNQVKSKHIGKGQVKNPDLADNAVTSPKVADGSLLDDDFAPGQLPAGPQGEQGPVGPPGQAGADGSPDTPQQVLDKIKQVDGNGSGLDADVLDGTSAAGFIQSGQTAGGSDLTGTYPNPTIAGGAVGPDELGPVPSARAETPLGSGCSLGQTITSGTETLLQFGGETFDQGGLHESTCDPPVNTRLTAPRAGLYQVSAGVLWPPNANGKRTLAITTNGSYVAQDEYDAAATGATIQSTSTLVRLAQGGFVDAHVIQTSGGNLVLDSFEARTFLAMAWLAP